MHALPATPRQPLHFRAAGAFFWPTAALATMALPGCAVVAVTATAVSVTASAVGLAADVAVGTARIVGQGIGKAADALSDAPPAGDGSGVQIHYRVPESPAPAPASP